MANITPARKLFDLLVSRDFDPEMLDSTGRPAPDPAETEIFSFDFRARSGKDYGTVVIMLGDSNELEVYCSDNVGRSMEGEDKGDWFGFLEQLKNFATRNFMSFGIKNLNRLRYSMQGQAAIKEGLFESWQGKKDVSWNAGANESRLMIKHKRSLGEGEARFRYVESLFIETADGERYKLPFKNLTAGKAMLEHVRSGGKPYDVRGQHIAEMVSELTVLSRFRRANTGKLLEGDTAQLVEQTNAYYENLQHNLKSLTTRRGYETYFESWSPSAITEESVVIEGLKHLFVTQSIDQRIEDALPLIARIQQQENAMKEAAIFEAWAQRLTEGTWQTPDTPEKQAQLIELMSQDLPVGADATNATEQLYDLLGDDVLFDQLEELADRDANADARQVIFDRMQELSNDPDVSKVINSLNIDNKYEMNPPDATNPADLEPMNESRLMDEASETIKHILNRFKYEVRHFEQGGDLDEKLYDALFDYYNDRGEMPYGVAKARTGDPMNWVADHLRGYLLGKTIMGGAPEEDYSLERESVANYAEEKDRIQELAGLAPIAARVAGAVVADKIGQALSDEEVDEAVVDTMEQDCNSMNEVQFINKHGMTKGQYKEKQKAQATEDEMDEGMSDTNKEFWSNRSNNWAKLERVIDGVKTPEQFQSALNYARLMRKQLSHGVDDGIGGDHQLMKDYQIINNRLKQKAAALGIDARELEEDAVEPTMESTPDPMLSRIKTLAAIMVK